MEVDLAAATHKRCIVNIRRPHSIRKCIGCCRCSISGAVERVHILLRLHCSCWPYKIMAHILFHILYVHVLRYMCCDACCIFVAQTCGWTAGGGGEETGKGRGPITKGSFGSSGRACVEEVSGETTNLWLNYVYGVGGLCLGLCAETLISFARSSFFFNLLFVDEFVSILCLVSCVLIVVRIWMRPEVTVRYSTNRENKKRTRKWRMSTRWYEEVLAKWSSVPYWPTWVLIWIPFVCKSAFLFMILVNLIMWLLNSL